MGGFFAYSRAIGALLLLVFACVPVTSHAGDSPVVDRSGRKVQLDGFLLDWIEKNKRLWSGSPAWHWDAINTAEGVAGYFHVDSTRCSSWTLYADPRHAAEKAWKMQPGDEGGAASQWYRTKCSPKDGSFAVTIEWIIPWDSLSIDSSGTYAINCAGKSTCGDTLQPLLISGSVPRRPNRLPPRFTERIVLIGVLLVTFFVLQRKIKKKSRRRESPHRSA